MPKFTVEHKCAHSTEQAFATVKNLLSNENEIKKFDAKAQVTFNDSARSCQIKGGQFKADLQVQAAGSGSQVSITVDLPLLLTPFKGKVQESLQKMLARHLG